MRRYMLGGVFLGEGCRWALLVGRFPPVLRRGYELQRAKTGQSTPYPT